jgi:hypothetical protein
MFVADNRILTWTTRHVIRALIGRDRPPLAKLQQNELLHVTDTSTKQSDAIFARVD